MKTRISIKIAEKIKELEQKCEKLSNELNNIHKDGLNKDEYECNRWLSLKRDYDIYFYALNVLKILEKNK